MSRRKSLAMLIAALVVAGGSYAPYMRFRALTLADALRIYGNTARMRLAPHFRRAGVAYPPKRIALLAFKKERRLSLWAGDAASWRFIRSYPILAASGNAGPKLRQGDYRMVSRLRSLEVSRWESLGVQPPRNRETTQPRNRGKAVGVGDLAIEELFTLAVAAALRDFPPWMESNSAMDIWGMPKGPKVLPAR